MNLNPIFNPGLATENKQLNPISSSTMKVRDPQPRQVRSDKKDDIKFPITETMRDALSRGYRSYKKLRRGPLFETGYHTKLIENALLIHKDNFPHVEYKDTKTYKHVKLVQLYSDRVFELSVIWNCSQREAVYRIMYSVVERNELL